MRGDSECYNRFLEGDTASYDELMIRYGDALTFYLFGYLHNWHDAEDLMIEAFARIMVKKPRIREGSFKAYLYKTARNLATRFHERKSRWNSFDFDELKGEIPDLTLPEETLWNEERKKILHLCLERIDPVLKEALWLVYLEDLSYAEAAAVMGVNTKRVDHLLTRGKEHLRKELAKEGMNHADE